MADEGTEVAGRHLLAVIDQHPRVVLGQVAVATETAGKTSEINRFTPLLDTLVGVDLTGVVITADALHTQREHAGDLHAQGAHWVLAVTATSPAGPHGWRRSGRRRREVAG
ncbi:transposase [Pseudonocardia sp. MH-G8]|uniref:transposase n=1 Tax=Pseudonocardia sp. MH-G8 TaxID=1854588 RepID=UPI0018E9AA5A